MQSDSPSMADAETTLGNIRRAEVSLNSNTFPGDVSDRARAALDAARQALNDGDRTKALAASTLAIELLAEALH
ncbi:hypothetical protein J7E97_27575 [Streptomyces sp. ISL-66]|uniref:hypothetical protein n=1 Tax=Streptomyces sp. ISL-66 TaxID=2819186 RepID=UPI001BE7F0BC|nr:hypothetical protein [Streptomyces sp. ISL-66]MBT2471522.1 hypothetical protein [Streptomyces sp. ISL-66]